MQTKSGVGYSNKREAIEAAKEVTEKAMKNAGITDCDLVLLFSTIGYDQPLLIKIIKRYQRVIN